MEDMGMVTVSVLMLTYNRENMVARAIKSILTQTFRDFEFIIVDNGSTDRSSDIAEEYAAKDCRVRVIHRERGTIGAGRNTALDAARGKYLTFIDDDDWADPDFLEFLVHLIEEDQSDVAICGAADRAFNEKMIMTAERAVIELMWRKKYSVAFPTKLFRRELMESLRFPEETKYDDIALMYRLLAQAGQVAYHGLPKYTFYRHPNNHSAWTTDHSKLTPETLIEYLDVYRARTKWLSAQFPGQADTFQYFEWSFMISMVEKINRFRLLNCEQQREDMEAVLSENRFSFIHHPLIQPFERIWMDRYVDQTNDYADRNGVK